MAIVKRKLEVGKKRQRQWVAAGTVAGTALLLLNANLTQAHADQQPAIASGVQKNGQNVATQKQVGLKANVQSANDNSTQSSSTQATVSGQHAGSNEPTAPVRQETSASGTPAASATPVTQPDSAAIQAGIAPVDTQELANIVPAQPHQGLTIPKQIRPQSTYVHQDGAGQDTDLRRVDHYSPNYQVPGAFNWQGESYANHIAIDAKGEDKGSSLVYADGHHPLYIDEWLPDGALQDFIWENNFSRQYKTFNEFRQQFTKAQMATDLTDLFSQQSLQSVNNDGKTPTQYYWALTGMYSLEGLQNATHLKTIYLSPDPLVGFYARKGGLQAGNLWDIRALKSLQELTSVNISSFAINDISALADKKQLTEVELDHNQIADISPLASDQHLKTISMGDQHILLTPIVLPQELATTQLGYTTPSFIIKDQRNQNLPITGLDPA